MKLSNPTKRLISGSIALACVVFITLFSNYPFMRLLFTSFVALVIALALREYFTLCEKMGLAPVKKIGLIFSVLYTFCMFLRTQYPMAVLFPYFSMILLLFSLFLYAFIKGERPLINIAVTLFGIFYITLTLTATVNINFIDPYIRSQNGRCWLLYLILVTKATDVGAYFCGKLFGSHPFVPKISPKKTWEGAIAGFFSAIAVSLLFCAIANAFFSPSAFKMELWHALILGTIFGIIAQFGDLTESLLKRDAGIKDSSYKLPGMGGILDLVDSLIFTSPVLYLYLKMA